MARATAASTAEPAWGALRQEAIEFNRRKKSHNTDPLIGAAKALRGTQRGRAVPDLVEQKDAYDDPNRAGTLAAAFLQMGGTRSIPARIDVEKPAGGTRTFSLLGSLDELVWRAETTPLAHAVNTDQQDGVLSGRLRRTGDSWLLRPLGEAFGERLHRVHRTAPQYTDAVLTDVSNYYGSISLESLNEVIVEIAGPEPEFRAGLEALAQWNEMGVAGLPTGPDTSEVYGSAFLHPLDSELTETGISFIRLMDDVLLWVPPRAGSGDLIAMVDSRLDALGLTRSIAKTHVLVADEVESELKNAQIGYFTGGGGRISRADMISMFHNAVAPPLDLNALKFSVSCFAGEHNPYPVRHLLRRPDLLDQIPKQLYQLVRELAKHLPAQASRFFSLLGEDRVGEVVKYVVALGLAHSAWGPVEGHHASKVIPDSATEALRAAGIMLRGASDCLSVEEAVHIALTGRAYESRGATLSLRALSKRQGVRTAAHHIRHLRPSRILEAEWATGPA